jgi:hypothetical protein
MIQRQQSLWLLGAAVCAFLSYKFSFYSGTVADVTKTGTQYLNAITGGIPLMLLTGILGAGCLVTIFLYKDRKLQLKISIAALLISVLNIILFIAKAKSYTGEISLFSLITFVIPVLLFLAVRGIWKDEKLVKSLDRLR